MFNRRSLISFAAFCVVISLISSVASAAIVSTVVPITFTTAADQVAGLQIICTHSGASSTSWDYYSNGPTIYAGSTQSANVSLNLNTLTGQVEITGIQFTAAGPGGLVYSNYTRRVESAATMNMQNLHATLTSGATVLPVTNGQFSDLGESLVLNGGIISWNGAPNTRVLSSQNIVMPLFGETSNVAVANGGTPDSIVGDVGNYSIQLQQNLNSSLSGTILTVKYLITTYSGGFRSGQNNDVITLGGSFSLSGLVTTPEPAAIVMLLGLALSWGGYSWIKRRSRR
jgi:hypothetical protein